MCTIGVVGLVTKSTCSRVGVEYQLAAILLQFPSSLSIFISFLSFSFIDLTDNIAAGNRSSPYFSPVVTDWSLREMIAAFLCKSDGGSLPQLFLHPSFSLLHFFYKTRIFLPFSYVQHVITFLQRLYCIGLSLRSTQVFVLLVVFFYFRCTFVVERLFHPDLPSETTVIRMIISLAIPLPIRVLSWL